MLEDEMAAAAVPGVPARGVPGAGIL